MPSKRSVGRVKTVTMFKHLLVFFVLALQGLLALGFTNPIKQRDGSDPFMVSIYARSLLWYVLTGSGVGVPWEILLWVSRVVPYHPVEDVLMFLKIWRLQLGAMFKLLVRRLSMGWRLQRPRWFGRIRLRRGVVICVCYPFSLLNIVEFSLVLMMDLYLFSRGTRNSLVCHFPVFVRLCVESFVLGNLMKALGSCMFPSVLTIVGHSNSVDYSYYSAGTSGTLDNQRLHALRGSSTNIWDSTWSFAGASPPASPPPHQTS
jgi:hypothetical protein